MTALTWQPLGRTGRSYRSSDGRWTINRLSRLWELWDHADPENPTYHESRREAELCAEGHADA